MLCDSDRNFGGSSLWMTRHGEKEDSTHFQKLNLHSKSSGIVRKMNIGGISLQQCYAILQEISMKNVRLNTKVWRKCGIEQRSV